MFDNFVSVTSHTNDPYEWLEANYPLLVGYFQLSVGHYQPMVGNDQSLEVHFQVSEGYFQLRVVYFQVLEVHFQSLVAHFQSSVGSYESLEGNDQSLVQAQLGMVTTERPIRSNAYRLAQHDCPARAFAVFQVVWVYTYVNKKKTLGDADLPFGRCVYEWVSKKKAAIVYDAYKCKPYKEKLQ